MASEEKRDIGHDLQGVPLAVEPEGEPEEEVPCEGEVEVLFILRERQVHERRERRRPEREPGEIEILVRPPHSEDERRREDDHVENEEEKQVVVDQVAAVPLLVAEGDQDPEQQPEEQEREVHRILADERNAARVFDIRRVKPRDQVEREDQFAQKDRARDRTADADRENEDLPSDRDAPLHEAIEVIEDRQDRVKHAHPMNEDREDKERDRRDLVPFEDREGDQVNGDGETGAQGAEGLHISSIECIQQKMMKHQFIRT